MNTYHEYELAPGVLAIRTLEERLQILQDAGHTYQEAVALIMQEDSRRYAQRAPLLERLGRHAGRQDPDLEVEPLEPRPTRKNYASWLPALNEDWLISRIPLLTLMLLEGANVGQLWQMWTRWTAAGQNLWSWIGIGIALFAWRIWYLRKTPEEIFAIRCTEIGMFMNALLIGTVCYLRMIGRG